MRVTLSDSTSARPWPCYVMIRAVRAHRTNLILCRANNSARTELQKCVHKTGISSLTITNIERTKLYTKLQTDTTIQHHDHHLNEPPRNARHSGSTQSRDAVGALHEPPPRPMRRRGGHAVYSSPRAAQRIATSSASAEQRASGSARPRVHEGRAAGRGPRGAAAPATAPGRPAHR